MLSTLVYLHLYLHDCHQPFSSQNQQPYACPSPLVWPFSSWLGLTLQITWFLNEIMNNMNHNKWIAWITLFAYVNSWLVQTLPFQIALSVSKYLTGSRLTGSFTKKWSTPPNLASNGVSSLHAEHILCVQLEDSSSLCPLLGSHKPSLYLICNTTCWTSHLQTKLMNREKKILTHSTHRHRVKHKWGQWYALLLIQTLDKWL